MRGIMGESRIVNLQDARNTIGDDLDLRDQSILLLMLAGKGNRAIATKLHIPMSTVQRRTRKLLEKDIIRVRYELNHKRLGF